MDDKTVQIIFLIVNAAVGITLALAYFIRRVGDTSLGRVNVDQTKANEDLDKTKAITAQSDKLFDLFKSQLLINEENRKEREAAYKLFTEAKQQDEANYKVLKTVMEDNTQFLHGTLVKEIRTLTNTLTASNQIIFKMMGAEIGTAIANELALRDGTSDLFPFPEFDDGAWVETTLAPKEKAVCIYKRPLEHEVFLIASSSGCITDKEKVRLADRPGNFYAIFRYTNNLWGWVLKHEVATEFTQLKAEMG